MKFVLSSLQVGQSIQGRVEELLAGDELLINFEGDLLRVYNETKRPLALGDRVTVIVRAIEPLRFQLIEDRLEQRRKGHLDITA